MPEDMLMDTSVHTMFGVYEKAYPYFIATDERVVGGGVGSIIFFLILHENIYYRYLIENRSVYLRCF